MPNDNINIWILSFLLLSFNLLLLNNNYILRASINDLDKQISNYEKLIKIKDYELIEESFVNHTISHPDIELPESGFFFMIFIPEKSCPYLEQETTNLNKLHQEIGSKFKAYLVSEEHTLLFPETYGADFPYKIIDPTINLIKKKQIPAQPVSFLVNSRGLVHKARLSRDNSEEFYNEIQSFFDS